MGDNSTESLPSVIVSSMLFRKGLFFKMKSIKSKKIGLFYLAISRVFICNLDYIFSVPGFFSNHAF